jgi:Spy/CpxP family protein refolding chaperone
MKTNKTKLIAALVVGSLLVLGTALHAQDSTNTPPSNPPAGSPPPGGPPGGPGMRGRPSFDQIAQRLELTDDQKPKVKAILDDQMQKMGDLRADDSLSQEDRRAKMRSLRDDTNTKLQAILTPDQYAQWLKISQRRRPSPPPSDASNPAVNPPGAGNPPNAPPQN